MPGRPDGVDTSVPNVARMYDYYLGGKDNFEADRVAAEEIMRLVPVTRAEAMTNRQFLRLAARYLATDAGISQFLDIGVGLPTRGAVHEVAREVSEDARAAARRLRAHRAGDPGPVRAAARARRRREREPRQLAGAGPQALIASTDPRTSRAEGRADPGQRGRPVLLRVRHHEPGKGIADAQ